MRGVDYVHQNAASSPFPLMVRVPFCVIFCYFLLRIRTCQILCINAECVCTCSWCDKDTQRDNKYDTQSMRIIIMDTLLSAPDIASVKQRL